MIYLEHDFYSNFNSMAESNDDASMKGMFIDQISNIIAYKKNDLVKVAKKHNISLKKKDGTLKSKLQLFSSLKRKDLL